MTAANKDRDPGYAGDRAVREHDAAAAVKIYYGTAVCLDAAGNANPGADTTGLKMAGVSRGDVRNGQSTCDNSTGSAGDKKVEVFTRGVYSFAAAGLSKADIGKPCWLTDDQTVQLTPAEVFAGILVDIDGATVALVDIEPAVREGKGLSRNAIALVFTSNATVTGAVQSALELPFAVKCLRIYGDVLTAPGSTDTATCTITDGTSTVTLTITGTDVQGEDEALTEVFPADTDISVTFARTGSLAATMTVVLWVEPL